VSTKDSSNRTAVEGKIGLYIFDLSKTTFEPFIRNIQRTYQPKVIIFKSLIWGGRSYAVTDGKRKTDDLNTPVVELKPEDFVTLDELILSVENVNIIAINITFDEINQYVIQSQNPIWDIIGSFPLCLSFFSFCYAIRNLYLYFKYKIVFGNPYLALIFEFFSFFVLSKLQLSKHIRIYIQSNFKHH